MKSGLSFLLAARQCEIRELERLAETGTLVNLVSRFTHRQLRIMQGTVKLVDPVAQPPAEPGAEPAAADEHSDAAYAAEAEQQESA